jgi:hypothetical protein
MKYPVLDHRRGVPLALVAIVVVASAILMKYFGH